MSKPITEKGAKIQIEEYELKDEGHIYIAFLVEGKIKEVEISHDEWADFAEYDIDGSKFYNEYDEEGSMFRDYDAWYKDNFTSKKAIELIEFINLKKSRS